MSRFTIDTPKPPEDRWPVLVDFSDRLNPALDEDGYGEPVPEKIYAVNVIAYRLWGYDEVKDEVDLTDAQTVSVTVEKLGGTTMRRSWTVDGQESIQIRFPTDYNSQMDQTVIDVGSITIGPDDLDNQISFVLQAGEEGNHYAIRIRAQTDDNNEHSCVLRFSVEEIEL